MRKLFGFVLAAGLSGQIARASGPATVRLVCIDPDAIGYATFQSHNQKVVANSHGIFMAYLHWQNAEYTSQTWRLLRSTDGGATFSLIYEATHATATPILETDEEGNIYLIRVDNIWDHNASARLYLFSPASNFQDPRITEVPGGSCGKYAMRYDAARQQLYLFGNNERFHVIGLDGTVRGSVQLLQAGANANIMYPYLDLASDGVLHAAWTTQKHGEYLYWDIHHMLSRDGGGTWENLDGAALALPVIADDTGPATRITLDDEFSVPTWLSNMRVKDGKVHFLYQINGAPERQHYMRYDIATHERDMDLQPQFKGDNIVLSTFDGFFATRSDDAGSPLYCVGEDQSRHIACLVSHDNGQTWHDYAQSTDAFPYAWSLYSIGGCREITDDGHLIGSFTDRGAANDDTTSQAYFFRISPAAHGPVTLLHRWSFTSDAGDSVGGANGTLHGSASVAGGRLDLTSGGWMTTPGIRSSVEIDRNLTVEVWVTDIAELDNFDRVWSWGTTMWTNEFGLYARHDAVASGNSMVVLNTPVVNAVNNVGNQPVSNAQYVAVAVDKTANEKRLYVDGAPVDAVSLNGVGIDDMDHTAAAYVLGHIYDQAEGEHFQLLGKIDEYRIWDGAMTDAQVAASYARGPDNIEPPFKGMMMLVK